MARGRRAGAPHGRPARAVTSRPARQAPLLGLPEQGRRPVYCRNPQCRRELTDPESRRNGYGKDCDPENHPGPTARHDVDQDPLPGT
ncbi:DUF6011 domain-containing protein [Streptomyces sp. NPDC021098]|uniref:DUF6011 domain-containing protein n=1 Tax=Streptomyces sp. NPDC021098 TaxID=3365113 RepID=UPI0037B37FF0